MITVKRLNNAIDKMECDATLILSPEEMLEVMKLARDVRIIAQRSLPGFLAHAEEAANIVAKWPEWKRAGADILKFQELQPEMTTELFWRNALSANAALERAGVINARERHESDTEIIRGSVDARVRKLNQILYPIGVTYPAQHADAIEGIGWEDCDGVDGRPLNPGYKVRVS